MFMCPTREIFSHPMKDYDLRTGPVPALDRLPDDGVEAIHEASMHVVENLGIRIDHDEALAVFEENGASVGDDNVVTLPREVVEECVAEAPSSFTLHARNPDNDVEVGGDSPTPLRAPGYGPSNVCTYEDGRRRSTLSDFEDLLKLVHQEDVLHCAGYDVCEPTDVDRGAKHLEMVRRALTLTDLPPMVSPYGEARTRACLDLVGIAVDDPDLTRPYAAALVNTVPPRSQDEKLLGGLLALAERGQPAVISSFTMAGTSGPATLAGVLAQANAENLVAITLAQLVNPGTPVVYGLPSAPIDARYGSLSIGSPESALFVSAAGQLGRYYGVPSRAGGGLSDAKTVDYQGGFESMLTLAATEFAGIDFVLHACGILDSYATISPEKLVLDCEMIRYLDRFRAGYRIDEEHLALDLMAETAPAEDFQNARHTRGEDPYRTSVADKRSYGDWEAAGSKTAFERGRDRVAAQLDAYERPALDQDIERDLDAYVAEATSVLKRS